MKRYLAIIGGAVFILVLLILLISVLFGGKKDTVKQPTSPQKQLVDYASTDTTVSLRTRGIINGNDIHREIQITINRNTRQINVIRGYQNETIRTQSLPNNEAAYTEFLSALNRLNFTKERKTSAPKDGSGVCPLGNIYFFNLNDSGRDITTLWSATCGGIGTMSGNYQNIVSLFQNQISNYSQLTRDVDLFTSSASGL